MLKIELKEAIKELKKMKAKKIFLQIPEGLKVRVDEITDQLEEKGFEIATSMDPCFGACDLKQGEAKRMECDAILHIGHTKFVAKTTMPTVYAPFTYDLGDRFDKMCKILTELLKDEKITSVGLTTTVQFLKYLPDLQKYLNKNGIKAVIGKGKRANDGQVLGCNYSSAQVDPMTIIYLGDGLFHPLGIHFATQKKVLIANPMNMEITTLNEEKDKFLRQRIMLIERAKAVGNYAIIVSTKDGQSRMSDALRIKKEIEKKGKKAKIYLMDFVSNNALLGVKAEALINTACPRISIDDYFNYTLPIINLNEIDYLLGKKDYEHYALAPVY